MDRTNDVSNNNDSHADGLSREKTDIELYRPVYKNGVYSHPWPGFRFPSFCEIMWMVFCERFASIPPKPELDKQIPMWQPDLEMLSRPPKSGMRVTWIGHSTCLIQTQGLNILTDPLFSSRCSPLPAWFGIKRYREAPFQIKDLPRIHAVLISHNHYDHLDIASVRELNERFGEGIRWFVPAGMLLWMQSVGCENTLEMDWWEESCVASNPDVKFVFVPAQHWSKRTAFDLNKSLWGGWCVIGSSQRFYYVGDSGYCPAFKQIGSMYGPFDIAAIPIGAYAPRWFMKEQHIDPEDAVQIHIDVKAKRSLAIHWGTFNLSGEAITTPPIVMQEAAKTQGLSAQDFFTIKHGASIHIGDNFHSVD